MSNLSFGGLLPREFGHGLASIAGEPRYEAAATDPRSPVPQLSIRVDFARARFLVVYPRLRIGPPNPHDLRDDSVDFHASRCQYREQ